MKRKPKDDIADLLDVPAAVAEPPAPSGKATPSKLHGDIAMYNRKKSDPLPGQQPDKPWVLVVAGVPQFFVERKPCSKAFKAAVRGGTPAAPRTSAKRAAADPAAPVASTDPDVERPSDAVEGLTVPSVWQTDESCMGLLVHVRDGTAKMISMLGGDYSVSKAPVETLFTSRDNAMHDYRHQAAEWGKTHKDKDYPDKPGDRWWATTYSPRRFCEVAYKSSQNKSANALAFMAKIMAAPVAATDDDLLGVGTEEDLLA